MKTDRELLELAGWISVEDSSNGRNTNLTGEEL